jgi:hypothetical protein
MFFSWALKEIKTKNRILERLILIMGQITSSGKVADYLVGPA